MTQHSARASHALQSLAESDPALSALALWCVHRDGDDTRTTGDTITYGPAFEDLSLHEQIGLAAHHVLHVALRHPARLTDMQVRLGDGFDADLYNLVADAVINETLLLSDYALPRPAVTLVALLRDEMGETTTSEEALANWDVDRLYHALVKSSQRSGRKDGKTRSLAEDHQFRPDLDPKPGGGDAGDTKDAADWRQHVARAMDAGRQAGRGIGRFGHRIADILAPVIPWELILRRLLSRAVMMQPQPTQHRPSRRWIAGAAEAHRAGSKTPGFEPGIKPRTDVPRIAVALDASGSIDDARLSVFWSEVTGIVRRMRAELHLLVFDDAVRSHVVVDPAAQRIELPDIPRGGGTAFRPVIEKAQELDATALVVLTDLEGEPGVAPKGLDVIWTVPDGITTTPPYGRLVNMSR